VNNVSAQTASDAGQRASGSSFYTAMRIMPREQREAMFEIYSFCRAVDDIADEGGDTPDRLKGLQGWRDDIAAIYAGKTPANLLGLAEAVRNFDLQREDFLAVIDGMEMDVTETICAPDFAKLDLYCDRVASAVGRLSVRVFGMEKNDGLALAHHLGRALQLTNILRDLDEDAAIGRLYLPKEALLDAGITVTDPDQVLASPTLGKACAPVVARAEQHFVEADKIMDRSPRRAVKAPRIMSAAYRPRLAMMVERGWDAPREKVSLSRSQFVWILLRYAIV
jgi:presqualene diphosphate synthase